jgi:hypothetical protein
MKQKLEEIKQRDIFFSITEDGVVEGFDLIKFLKYIGSISGITFWVTLGRGIQELETTNPYHIHIQSGNAGYATYMLMSPNGKVPPGGHGHLQISTVDKISFEVLPSCTCLPATYNIFFEDIALRSALLNVSFPIWWDPNQPEDYQYYPEAYEKFMHLVQHFGTVMMKVDGKWMCNDANIFAVEKMHILAKKRFEKIYSNINYVNNGIKRENLKHIAKKYKDYIIHNNRDGR